MLEANGLTLIRPNGGKQLRSAGEGSVIDYALVTTSYVSAIISAEAVRDVPLGTHCGFRATFKTNTAEIEIPEIVRPESLKIALEQSPRRGFSTPKTFGGHDQLGSSQDDDVRNG